MKNKIKTFSYLFVIIVLAYLACDVASTDEHSTQFNVYTILINRAYNEVFVDRTYDIDEPSEPYIDDALVTLSTGNTADTLVFDAMYERYIAWYMDIQPGTTYCLEVSKHDLDTLFGITTVPDEFEFINQPSDTITLEDTVIFSRSDGAIIYYCSFYIPLVGFDEFWLKPDTLDSLVKIRVGDYIGNIAEGFCNIEITAFDHNFYKYFFEPDDSLRQAGVTGGLGLCGSAWRESITLYLILSNK